MQGSERGVENGRPRQVFFYGEMFKIIPLFSSTPHLIGSTNKSCVAKKRVSGVSDQV